MKYKVFPWAYLLFAIVACADQPKADISHTQTIKTAGATAPAIDSILHPTGTQLRTRFAPPSGFRRVEYGPESFGTFLQNFPLKAHDSPVLLYNGQPKSRQDVHAAVFEIDVGRRDLQQCADAIMRLRAEYLWEQKRYNAIHFNFTNGFRADYGRWRNGDRIRVNGNAVRWVVGRLQTPSYEAFRDYLTMVFSYAGTLSLSKELAARELDSVEVGDVFIQGGSPGHAILVVDKAVDTLRGETLIMLAQSYMPAQEIHVLRNPFEKALSPWYSLSALDRAVRTPEWSFRPDDLARF